MGSGRARRWLLLAAAVCFFFGPGLVRRASAQSFAGRKILVVMSYHATHPWTQELREGIEAILGGAEFRYEYLDAKNNPEGVDARGREAFEAYRSFRPEVVIAGDDDVQTAFVIPFLKDKEPVPVVFCGVNDDAGRYGYPASNVTGVVEKKHYRESIALAQLIVPSIRRLAVVYRDTSSNQVNLEQLRREQSSYGVEIVGFHRAETVAELEALVPSLAKKADALLVLNITGIADRTGRRLEGREAFELVAARWPKVSIAGSAWEVEAGLLCAVAKTGQEQGQLAGRMVADILGGKPLSQIPVTHNRNGKRSINVTTADKLGLTLRPAALLGAELTR